MAAIHVRDVSESTVSALRERAERHGWSMQHEIRLILDSAAAEPTPAEEVPPIQLFFAGTSVTSTWRREEMYGDEGR